MSSEFETGFVGSNRPAWHGLSTVVPGTLNLEEAWKQAGLDWEVRKEETFIWNERTGEYHTVPDTFAVVRDKDERILGTVGSDYTPIQNKQVFHLIEALLEQGAAFETAGSLFGGRLVWALARTEGFVDAVTGDKVVPYLVVSSGHDGGHRLRGDLTPTRVVCWNTLRQAINTSQRSFAIVHRSGWVAHVAAARQMLGLAKDVFGQLQTDLARLATIELGTRAPLIVDRLIPMPGDELKGRPRDRLLDDRLVLSRLIEKPTGSQFAPGTLYQAWSGISEFASHRMVPRRRVGTELERAERRMFDLTFDGGQRSAFAERGWQLLQRM